MKNDDNGEWAKLVESGVITRAPNGTALDDRPEPSPVTGAGAVSDLAAEQRWSLVTTESWKRHTE
ncbi:MAG: hypothetical protein ACTHW1_09435 [Ancrocorticia sp.]|uniref:hypothetical protein n=1 Tax=Ancrocorticia sp. TaxID=2593684 RepID=UPI003F901E40